MKNDDKIIKIAQKRFKLAQDAEAKNRNTAREALDFANGDQWPEDVKAGRQLEGKPTPVTNRIKPIVEHIVNDLRRTRPSISTRPVDSKGDPDTSEVLSGLIRSIEQDSNASTAYDWAGEHAVKMGWGWWRIDIEFDDDEGFEQNIKINRVRDTFSVWADPSAEHADGSDGKWLFVESYVDRDDFNENYPDADTATWPEGADNVSHADWFTADKVRVVEYWCVTEEPTTSTLMSDGSIFAGEFSKDEKALLEVDSELYGDPYPVSTRKGTKRVVTSRIITPTEVLSEEIWPGKHIPFVRCVGEESVIDAETVYKGVVTDLISSQQEYNYAKAIDHERLALTPKAPFIGPKGAFADPKWATINTQNHAFVEYDGKLPPPTRMAPPEASTATVSNLTLAAEEMKVISGIYDAAVGAQSNEISGVAINARKTESEASNFHFIDNLERAIQYTGKILVNLIPEVYTPGRAIRIVKGDDTEGSVTLNEAYRGEDGQEKAIDLRVGRYDVVVAISPNYATQRQESRDAMIEIASKMPNGMQLTADIIAKGSDFPKADEFAERLQLGMDPRVLQGENPQIAQAMEQMKAQAEQDKQIMAQQYETLMVQAQQLQNENQQLRLAIQNKEQDRELKEAELDRKISKDMHDANRDMTKLEIEANKDLGPAGVYL